MRRGGWCRRDAECHVRIARFTTGFVALKVAARPAVGKEHREWRELKPGINKRRGVGGKCARGGEGGGEAGRPHEKI